MPVHLWVDGGDGVLLHLVGTANTYLHALRTGFYFRRDERNLGTNIDVMVNIKPPDADH